MTTIDTTNPATKNRVTAVMLKGHLRLQAAGMKHSKMPRRYLLDMTTRLTGKNYKNSVAGCTRALDDIVEYLK